jgi:hypothetical protein
MARGIIRNWKAIVDGDLSTSLESDFTDAAFLDKGRAFVEWSGADATDAEILVEISNDKEKWRSILSEPVVLSTPSGSHEIIFPLIDFGYMRFKTVPNSVTAGTINVSFSASTVGR